jgi:hypothetical protein
MLVSQRLLSLARAIRFQYLFFPFPRLARRDFDPSASAIRDSKRCC